MKNEKPILPERPETQLHLPHMPPTLSAPNGSAPCESNSTLGTSSLNLVVACSECGTGVVLNLDQFASRFTVDTGVLYGRETNGLYPRSGRANASGPGDDSGGDALASLTDKEKAYIKGFLAGCATTQAALEQDYNEAKKRLE